MSDFLDPLKLGVLVLFFVPGFIFIQGIERQLLRKHKPQFEKTFEIILASAVIWVLALPLYAFVFGLGLQNNSLLLWKKLQSKKLTVKTREISKENTTGKNNLNISRERNIRKHTESFPLEFESGEFEQVIPDFVKLFAVATLLAFLGANLWGFIRKKRFLDSIGKAIIGRNWHPSVKFKFLYENTGKTVEVQTGTMRYAGILPSVPDMEEDKYIILLDPMQILAKSNPGSSEIELEYKPLYPISRILLRIDEIVSMGVYSKKLV